MQGIAGLCTNGFSVLFTTKMTLTGGIFSGPKRENATWRFRLKLVRLRQMRTLPFTKRYLGHVVVAAVALQGFMLPILAHSRNSVSSSRVSAATPIVSTVWTHPISVVQVPAKQKHKLISQMASKLSGIASWYGKALHGHPTASGETFDETALTACHRTLPFGTLVKVTNLHNHRSVVVRINDRGVLLPERVIDLTSAAADRLGMLRSGTAPVKLAVVPPGTEQEGD
jgi:rare lipoprotein A